MSEISCDHCGVCCLEQSSPPGYALLLLELRRGKDVSRWPGAGDVQRIQALPRAAMRLLTRYLARMRRDATPKGEMPCIWLDLATMRCRFYEHRPAICRELEVGSSGCRAWRRLYQIGAEA